MAANAKGKRKVKGKTLDLNTFLGEDKDAQPGYAVIQPRKLDWADTMDNEDLDDRYTLDFKKEEKVVLPTAPKAARGPDVDLAKVPSMPPFTAFLGNLPYDVSEDDITFFFRQLQVKNVRLPRENGDRGRIRGFGYAEFNNRQDLIQALALNNESLKNRAIKIILAGEHDGDRGDRRDGGPDRTLGDWRSDKREQFSRDDSSRNDGFSSRGSFGDRDRDSFQRKSNFDRPFDRNDRFERNGGDRNDFGSRNERDFGSRDQDRFDRRGGERGYGFSDRGTNRGGGRNDRRDGGFVRRDDRDFRYRDSVERDPPRDSGDRRTSEKPSYDSAGTGTKERRKLQLAPRTKPIEPVPPPSAAASSSIFGGAKPVDTAAREREIEERLAREKDVLPASKDLKERESEARIRKFSSSSAVSNRSRRSSDSGPPREEEEHRPPVPRQLNADYNTLPRSRQRCESNGSTGSDRDGADIPKNPAPKKENYNRGDGPTPASHPEDPRGDFHSIGHSDNSRERATYEEPKPPVYTSANKFSHLMNDPDDLDPGNNSE